jgi:hypothetical protein
MRRTIAVFFMMVLCFGLIAAECSILKAEESAWERVGQRALQLVNWDWKPVFGEWDIRFGPERPGYHGLTEFALHRITIWIRPADSPEAVAGMIAHELAHAFDRKYLTPALRGQWLAARGLPPDTPWYFPVGKLGSDYLSGAGDFAESVKWTLQGPRAGFKSCLGLQLNEQQKKVMARGCDGILPNEAQQTLIRQWLAELPRTARTGEK